MGSNNLLQATVDIEGTRPIIWNHLRPSPDFGKRTEKSGSIANDPSEWKRSVLMTTDRQLYLLPTQIFSTWREAAKHTKRGKGTLMGTIASTLQVVERKILVDRFVPIEPNVYSEDTDEEVYIYSSITRNIATKGRGVRYRIAASPGWQCSFNLQFDRTIISRNEVHSISIDAGRLVGLIDGRGIGYGRFEIKKFEVFEV